MTTLLTDEHISIERRPERAGELCTAGAMSLCSNYSPTDPAVDADRRARWTVRWPRKTVLCCDAHMANAIRSSLGRYGLAVEVER